MFKGDPQLEEVKKAAEFVAEKHYKEQAGIAKEVKFKTQYGEVKIRITPN